MVLAVGTRPDKKTTVMEPCPTEKAEAETTGMRMRHGTSCTAVQVNGRTERTRSGVTMDLGTKAEATASKKQEQGKKKCT